MAGNSMHTGRDRQPDGDVAVVVMVAGEHGEDFLAHKEGRFAMGETLFGAGERQTDVTHAVGLSFDHCVSPGQACSHK
jgi:hypothetical protein